jgi:hypothetical protein
VNRTKTFEKGMKALTFYRFLREKNALTDDTVKGLTGLIVMGNAWESVDIFDALSWHLSMRRVGNVGYLAGLRVKELHKRGKISSIDPLLDRNQKEELYNPSHRLLIGSGEVQRQYPLLRREAEECNRDRQAYMLARLHQGRHPDTHPDFWSDYQETQPPNLTLSGIRQGLQDPLKWIAYLFLACVALLIFHITRKVYRWIRPEKVRPDISTVIEDQESVLH